MIYVPLLLMFVLLVLGFPVFLSMAAAGGIGLIMLGGVNTLLGVLSTTAFTSVAHYELLSVPLFILMANFLTSGNLTRDLFDTMQKWLGRLPGGLAIATVVAGAGLGALCGTSSAAAATLAGSAVPEMKKHGYSTELALGVVSISGTLSIMIPPSGTLVIFGLISGYSITDLFRAGILPGLLTCIVYCAVIVIWALRYPRAAPRLVEKVPFSEKMRAVKDMWAVILLLVIILASIFSGWFTITEASGIAALGAFTIALCMRRLTMAKILVALKGTLKTTAMIFTIIIGAMAFSYYLTLTQMTTKLVTFISSLPVSGTVIMLVLVLLYALLGFFMDQVAILYLTLPLCIPIVEALDLNIFWFAVLIVSAAATGLVTPPVGLNCYVVSATTGETLEKTFAGVAPFIVAEFVVLLLLFLFPWFSTALL